MNLKTKTMEIFELDILKYTRKDMWDHYDSDQKIRLVGTPDVFPETNDLGELYFLTHNGEQAYLDHCILQMHELSNDYKIISTTVVRVMKSSICVFPNDSGPGYITNEQMDVIKSIQNEII